MHELTIAYQVLEIVSQLANDEGARIVNSVTLRVGALTAVHEDSLRFGFDIAKRGTLADGASLIIIHVPVAVECRSCGKVVELPGIQSLRCPNCLEPSTMLVRGRELDIESMEIDA